MVVHAIGMVTTTGMVTSTGMVTATAIVMVLHAIGMVTVSVGYSNDVIEMAVSLSLSRSRH